MRIRTLLTRVAVLLALVTQGTTLVHGQGSTITVDPAVTHQTMRGWEVVAFADRLNPTFPLYKDAALNSAVDAGINRIRLEVRSGSENPVDAFAQWQAAGYPTTGSSYTTWRAKRYETINDNADPNVINPAGFNWTDVDGTIDDVVTPLRQKLSARGESLYVHFDYVAFLSQVTSGAPYVHQNPAEYAEFMLATFQHLQSKYGWTPDGLAVILEPDNTSPPWSGTLLGQVIAATGPRLAAAGFTPDFIGPATACMSTAIPWFDNLIAVPNVRPYLKELAYHRYCGVDPASLQTIASRASAIGIATAMLEWWDTNNTFNTVHEDVKVGRNSAWEQAGIADRTGTGSVSISHITDTNQAILTNKTKFFRQYYQHVRQGAVRIGATSQNAQFDPLAFRNANGTFTVVVKANAGGAFTVGGLPAGNFGINYTASSVGSPDVPDLEGSAPDQTIAAGQMLSVTIPAYGVVTVFGKSPQRVAQPVPPDNLHIVWGTDGSVALGWTPPTTGPTVTGFLVEGGLAPGAVAGTLPLGLTPTTTLALPGGSYYLRVRSLAGTAVSAASSEVVAHVGAVMPPSAPSNLQGLVVGNRLHLTWRNTWSGGTPTTMTLDVAGAIATSLPLGLNDTFSFFGVPPGTYTFSVRNSNARGSSPSSNPVTLTFPTACSGAPQPVTNFVAYDLGGTLFLSWEVGAEGPAPTSYIVNVTGGYVGSVATPLKTISGQVPPGTYTIRVAATNACGTSAASAWRTIVVP